MSIDIHARRSAEQHYRDSERRNQQFADASSDVLWLRDAGTLNFVSLSRAFDAVFGLPAKAVMPPGDFRRWIALIVPEDRAGALRALETVRHGRSVVHEYRILRPSDGEFRWIRSTDFR